MHQPTWNGTCRSGRSSSSGTYSFRIGELALAAVPHRPVTYGSLLSMSRKVAFTGVILATGLTIAGWGIGGGIDNIVTWSQGRGWTASAGGSEAGIGVALVLVALLLRRPRTRWWSYVLCSLGAVLAGYSLGGGVDDLLREIDGDGHHLAPGMALFGLGVGLVVVGMMAKCAREPSEPRPHKRAV